MFLADHETTGSGAKPIKGRAGGALPGVLDGAGRISTVQEDIQAFMERHIRDRAVAPLDPGSPGLLPQERRSWWEFCLGMCEFLGGLIKNHVVGRELTHQIGRLHWIALRGTYLFSMRDPALRGEQRRYVELCVIMGAAFAAVVDDAEGLRDACDEAFGPVRFWSNGDPKQPAEVEAIVGENWLRFWRNWEHARSPIGWVHLVAEQIHYRHCPLSMDENPDMWSLDAPSPTGDSYAALLRDPQAVAEYPTLDLDIACEREGLAPETALLAFARYNGVPNTFAAEVLGVPEEDLARASRELQAAMPALQARLKPYLDGSKPVFRRGESMKEI